MFTAYVTTYSTGEKIESRNTLINVQRKFIEVLVFFVKNSTTNSQLVFNKLLPQLRANLGPLKIPKTDPTGPPPAPPFPDGMRPQLVSGPRMKAEEVIIECLRR